MGFLRRFKIHTRLVTMSVTLIVFTIMMGVIGSLNIVSINDSTNIVFDKEVKSLAYLQSIRESFLKVGSALRDIALENGREVQSRDELEAQIYKIQGHYMDMADYVINFTGNLEKYERTENEVANIRKIEDFIENDYREVVNNLIREARLGAGLDELSHIVSTGDSTASALEKLIDDMYNENLLSIRVAQQNSIETVRITRASMVFLNVVIVLISILMGRLITRSITIPIKNLLNAASKITQGEFDVKIESTHKDEVGNLSKSFYHLIGTIRELISEMEGMSEKHTAGDIDASVDESKFMGNYLRVAQGINRMVNDLVKDMLAVTECLTEFGNGNFKADIPQFPYKKAIVNKGINELRLNLTTVSEEINNLVRFATSGELKKRADFTKYNGDWATIIIGLNDLLEAIIIPINEASSALQEFSQGNLNICMKGDYKGDFATIEKAINMTVSAISSYMVEIDQVLGTLVNDKNFNVQIDREYIGDFVTIKESINKIIYTFNGIIMQMNMASFQVSEDAKEITESSLALSNGTVEQTNMIDKLNTEIDVLEKQTILNAENAKQANSFAKTANDSTIIANKDMEQMLEAMQEISKASIDASKIIKVINDISFQTNLLALNASIEASRAGIHGKGFSVVAEEVRNLANKSKEAADQTTDIIESTIKKINDGSVMANKTAVALEQISSQINSISVLISNIDLSSSTQVENIVQINEDISIILQVAKDAKISSEATLSCSKELLHQSDSLKAIVQEFNIVNNSYT